MKRIRQNKIAAQIGLSESRLSRYLSGKRNPSIEVADELSKLSSTDIRVWLLSTEKNIQIRKESLKEIKSALNKKAEDL